MAAVHTEAPSIFGGILVNEAEDKIQYVKYRPSQPYDSNTPIPFKIPGNTNQYVSLHDSYLYIKCHVEHTDEYGKHKKSSKGAVLSSHMTSTGTTGSISRRHVEDHYGDDDTDEEEDPRANGKRTTRDTLQNPPPKRTRTTTSTSNTMATSDDEEEEDVKIYNVYTADQIAKLEFEAITRHQTAVESMEEAVAKIGTPEYESRMTYALGVQDVSDMANRQYMQALMSNRIAQTPNPALLPIDNVMHSMWNGVDIFMNGELVSTTNQKYMYKAYMETILNNSHSTKQFQLKSSGFYGDSGDRDKHFFITKNMGMMERKLKYDNENKVEMMGFLLSDIMGIQASIVNGVEIEIILTPNLDNIRLQGFGKNQYGRMIIDDIVLFVCKRTFSKEVLLAHASLMEHEPAIYPFKKTEVRAYNGNSGNTQVVIENPYESKIPTRFILGMIDADAYIGNWEKNPLNFQHYNISKAAFYIDDETIAKPPYYLNPTRGQFLEPLMELYKILGKAGEDQDIGISPEDYISGLFLLPFDVTPTSAANMEYLSKQKGGNCRIELQFRQPLPNNIIILAYAIFPQELRIDMARNCASVPV